MKNRSYKTELEELQKRYDTLFSEVNTSRITVFDLRIEIAKLKSKPNYRKEAEQLWHLLFDVNNYIFARFPEVTQEHSTTNEFLCTKADMANHIFVKDDGTANLLTWEEKKERSERFKNTPPSEHKR